MDWRVLSRPGTELQQEAQSPTADGERAYRSHGHSVLRRAQFLLGNEADALDVTQEVFLTLIEKPEQFSGQSGVLTWLYRATTNRCLNRIRDGKTRRRLLEGAGDLTAPAALAVPERFAEVRHLLARLPTEYATVVVYHYMDQMTRDEIAEVLGCSRRHVGNLIVRARAVLQEGETHDH